MMKKIFAALAVMGLASAAHAECTVDIEVGDSLAFSTGAIEVPASCDNVTVNLKHTGTLPKAAMGHNWVLATDADWEAVATAGMAAGVDGNYLPADDARIIASTKLVGGGESDSITFSTGDMDAGGSYTFFCSFPGHWSVMRGSFKLV
ncbi:MAG: azurin [Pseudomonadota bacterium]